MGFLSGIGKAVNSPDFGMRLQAALAAAGGDQNAIYRMHELQRQQAELQLRQQAAQQEQQTRDDQVWGAKESGVGNPLIAGMNPDDLSRTLRERIAPHTEAPGTRYTTPSLNGGQDTVSTAPTMDEQQANFYESQQPGARAAFARRQAYGPPVAIQQGGGLAVPGPAGWGWGVAPDGVTPTPSGPAPGAGGPSARNNPAGLRRPGSTQFQSFPTEAAGIAAQERLLGRPQYLGTPHSVSDIVERYAPRRRNGGDNTDEQVNNYISHVSRRLGVDPSQPLSAADVPRVAAAMREVETGRRGTIPAAPRGGGQSAALIAEANRAIAAGADPAAVAARLRQMGVN